MRKLPRQVDFVAVVPLMLILAGCANPPLGPALGPAVLREERPQEGSEPLLEARDSSVAVTLDMVVIRNGPGAWARNALWDEYRFRIRSLSGSDVSLVRITLFDAQGQAVQCSVDRGQLIDATREAVARYRASGRDADRIPSEWALDKYAAAFALVVGSLAPFPFRDHVLAAKIIDDEQVASELERRHTPLPAAVSPVETNIVVFFPIVPAPSALEVSYLDDDVERVLRAPTQPALSQIHAPTVAQIIHRSLNPTFPPEAARSHLEKGQVRARLSLDREGNVTAVEIVETSSPEFIREAWRRFYEYKYTAGTAGRTVEEVMHFRRGMEPLGPK